MLRILFAVMALFAMCSTELASAKGGGLCKTGFGTPADGNSKCWQALFARAQPDQAGNPKKAVYGADWKKVMKNYPEMKKTGRQVHAKVKSFWGKKVNLKKLNSKIPFTRLCVPTNYGLKSCGLKKGAITGRVNPNGYPTDATSKLFIKFYWDPSGKFVSGRTGH